MKPSYDTFTRVWFDRLEPGSRLALAVVTVGVYLPWVGPTVNVNLQA